MIKRKSDNDIQMVSRLKKDDVKAFESIFSKYNQKVYHFANKYLKSKKDAEDIVQDVFFIIWKKRKNLKKKLSFSSYLFTITFNAIKKRFLKRTQYNFIKNIAEDIGLVRDNYLELKTDYHTINTKLDKIIEGMPMRLRVIYKKKIRDGKSIKEIAAEMNISPKTVENQITKANKVVSNQLYREKSELIFNDIKKNSQAT